MLPDYLVVGPGLAAGAWVVVPGMYETHLKHRQYFQPISFNNIGPQLTYVVGVVWDTSIACDNWRLLT